KREAVDAMCNAVVNSLRFGQSDPRKLGIGERAPRHDGRRLDPAHAENRVAAHDAGVVFGQVRELEATRSIADDEDPGMGRAHTGLRGDAARAKAATGSIDAYA